MISPEQTSRAACAIARLISPFLKVVERLNACANRQSPTSTLKRVTPARVHRRLAATPLRFIHDVVVHQRCDMDQLEDDGEIHVRVDVIWPVAPPLSKRDERAQTLALPANRISDVAFDRRIELGCLLLDPHFHLIEMDLHGACNLRQRSRSERVGGRLACENFHTRRIEVGVSKVKTTAPADGAVIAR